MRALILSGGKFHKEFCKRFIKNLGAYYFDLILCADKGLKYALELGLKIDYAIGDFDSFPIWKDPDLYEISDPSQHAQNDQISRGFKTQEGLKKINFIRLNAEKDTTDTHEAIALAVSKGADEIHLLAATGDRFDHSLANILLLKYFQELTLFLVDQKNKIRLLSPRTLCRISKKEQYADYISLIPISPRIEGVEITGCKYNIRNRTILLGDSIGISNEIIEDTACFSLKEGYALLIESRD